MNWARHLALFGMNRNAYKSLFGKSEAKEPLDMFRGRLHVRLIHLIRDTVQWHVVVEHGNEPWDYIKGGKLLD
jgi:hypothetical protein